MLDAGVAVGRGAAHRRDESVVELERRAGQPGAVDREVRVLPRERALAGEVGEGLHGGEEAVGVGERGPERAHEVGITLDREDAAGAVVGRQDQPRPRTSHPFHVTDPRFVLAFTNR